MLERRRGVFVQDLENSEMFWKLRLRARIRPFKISDPHRGHPPDAPARQTAVDGLIDHAVALRKLEQLLEPLRSSVGLNVERQPDPSKADRHILGDPERAAEIEIALG